MEIEFDPSKRDATLEHRGLDFADAGFIFESIHFTIEDDRVDYGEPRFQTVGALNGELVAVVWTTREGRRRIISMRRCHEREYARFRRAVERS